MDQRMLTRIGSLSLNCSDLPEKTAGCPISPKQRRRQLSSKFLFTRVPSFLVELPVHPFQPICDPICPIISFLSLFSPNRAVTPATITRILLYGYLELAG